MRSPIARAVVLAGSLTVLASACGRGDGSSGSTGPVRFSTPGGIHRAGVAEVTVGADFHAVAGQRIYVPVYSHVLTSDDARPFRLAVTLSVRNTDRDRPLVLTSVRYHDSDGRLVRDALRSPLRLSPLAAVDFFVEESDMTGGSSANFLVEWAAETPVSSPVVEAVMIGTASTQGISFLSSGRVVWERTP